MIRTITSGFSDDCSGVFVLRNETSILGFGGYTLELRKAASQNLDLRLNPSSFLSPSIDVRAEGTPVDTTRNAQALVSGELTVDSWALDTGFFALKIVREFAGLSCAVPDEQIMLAAINLSTVSRAISERALKRDLKGVLQLYDQMALQLYTQAKDAFREIGWDCAAQGAEALIGQPAVVAKLGVEYLAWVPVVIADYFRYQGQPVEASVTYAAPAPTPTPVSTATPRPIPRATQVPALKPDLPFSAPVDKQYLGACRVVLPGDGEIICLLLEGAKVYAMIDGRAEVFGNGSNVINLFSHDRKDAFVRYIVNGEAVIRHGEEVRKGQEIAKIGKGLTEEKYNLRVSDAKKIAIPTGGGLFTIPFPVDIITTWR